MNLRLSRKYLRNLAMITIVAAQLSADPAMDGQFPEEPFAPVSLDMADSILSNLSLEEKIALCFVVTDPSEEDLIHHAGGFYFNSASKRISTHGSAHPFEVIHFSMLDSITQTAVSALTYMEDPDVIMHWAMDVGNILHSQGINVVYGLPLDVLNDLNSPSAAMAFGHAPESVIEVAEALTEGFRLAGVHTVAGSFPGIGSTQRDFEQYAPMVFAEREALNGQDLVPFKAMVNDGISGISMANAFVPALDSSNNIMASNSYLIHQLLREKMGFKGLIWSDASHLQVGDDFAHNPAVQSLIAGSDLVLVERNLAFHIEQVKKQIDLGSYSLERLDDQCRTILRAQIHAQTTSKNAGSNKKMGMLSKQAFSHSLSIIQQKDSILPLRSLDTTHLVVIKIGQANTSLATLVDRYAPAQVYQFTSENLEQNFSEVLGSLEQANLWLIIAEGEPNLRRNRFGLSPSTERIINQLSQIKPSILIWNGSDMALQFFEDTSLRKALLIGHASQPWSDDRALQAVFGGRAITATPRRRIKKLYAKSGNYSTSQSRLAYGDPEEVGIDPKDLEPIRAIVEKGIKEMAYPGCQVWFAKDSIVVMDEAFGYHTYQEEQKVLTTDLYDLASITKIAGSIAALMKLTDEEKVGLDYRLCDYFGDWVDTTEYMQLSLREILAHQAGLPAWISFYSQTLSKGVPRYDVYSLAPSETYPIQVARELYIRSDYPDSMFKQILTHKLGEKKYKYSDVGYYFTQRIIEAQSGASLDRFVDSVYYRPLGLTTMGYRPLNRFSKDRITPTEYDQTFRGQLIHGYVHDPGAAMLGGVGGHAGLFSNANDLGILMQMYLNGGSYGGKRYFGKEVIDDFTRCQYCENDNRRGAGFDKPLTDGSEGPSCGCTSLDAFGHQGFTGTVTWADPEEDVVYVFLSNRVYPKANNKKLLELNIRTDIQKQFYQAIENGDKPSTP